MDEKKKSAPDRARAKIRNPAAQQLPLPKGHKCYGCVWYPRTVDILYCPFHSCVKNKKGFGSGEKKTYD